MKTADADLACLPLEWQASAGARPPNALGPTCSAKAALRGRLIQLNIQDIGSGGAFVRQAREVGDAREMVRAH